MIFDFGEEGKGVGVVGCGIDFLEDRGLFVEGDLYACHDTRFDLETLGAVTDSGDDEGALFVKVTLEDERAFLIRGSADG